MKIAGIYSFNGGANAVKKKYAKELEEVEKVLANVETKRHKTKQSLEKTMRDKILYSPRSLNKAISNEFLKLGWEKKRVLCDYSITPRKLRQPRRFCHHCEDALPEAISFTSRRLLRREKRPPRNDG